MHGAMSVGLGGGVENDPEGTIARDVRAAMGATGVLVMTLDLHANVTALMVKFVPPPPPPSSAWRTDSSGKRTWRLF